MSADEKDLNVLCLCTLINEAGFKIINKSNYVLKIMLPIKIENSFRVLYIIGHIICYVDEIQLMLSSNGDFTSSMFGYTDWFPHSFSSIKDVMDEINRIYRVAKSYVFHAKRSDSSVNIQYLCNRLADEKIGYSCDESYHCFRLYKPIVFRMDGKFKRVLPQIVCCANRIELSLRPKTKNDRSVNYGIRQTKHFYAVDAVIHELKKLYSISLHV